MTIPVPADVVSRLKAVLGEGGWSQDPDRIAPKLVEWRGRWEGTTPLLVLPRSTAEVSAVVGLCAEAGVAATTSKLAPDQNRPKGPLEAFPLETITMLGTITQNKETFALVKAGTNLYRVRKGNYLGQNFGVITGIDDGQISIKELIQDAAGEWMERSSALQLVEAKR